MKVCPNCFNDPELKSYIETTSTENGKCDFCNSETDSALLDIEELKDFFKEYLDIFSESADGEQLIEMIKTDWNLFSVNVDIQKILSDILDVIGSFYTGPNPKVKYLDEIIECTSYWEILKEDLKWKRRFLTDIDEITDLGWDSFFNKQITLSAHVPLFRARIHKDAGQNEFSVNEMGCPAREIAPVGRANPQGIPFLYLSKSSETTLYETRATFLDEISIGQFKIKDDADIVLVDFTEEVSAFEIFTNEESIKESTKGIQLKKKISLDLSKPIRRYDSELEYLPTQFICEFVRYITGADGILFNSSSHSDGINIVLFEEEKVECVSVDKHQVTQIKIESNII